MLSVQMAKRMRPLLNLRTFGEPPSFVIAGQVLTDFNNQPIGRLVEGRQHGELFSIPSKSAADPGIIECSADGRRVLLGGQKGSRFEYDLWIPEKGKVRRLSGPMSKEAFQDSIAKMDSSGNSLWLATETNRKYSIQRIDFRSGRSTKYDSPPFERSKSEPSWKFFHADGSREYLLCGTGWGYYNAGRTQFHRLAGRCPFAAFPRHGIYAYLSNLRGGLELELVKRMGRRKAVRSYLLGSARIGDSRQRASANSFSKGGRFAFIIGPLLEVGLNGRLWVFRCDNLRKVAPPAAMSAGIRVGESWIAASPGGPDMDTEFESAAETGQRIGDRIRKQRSAISMSGCYGGWLVFGLHRLAIRYNDNQSGASFGSVDRAASWLLAPIGGSSYSSNAVP